MVADTVAVEAPCPCLEPSSGRYPLNDNRNPSVAVAVHPLGLTVAASLHNGLNEMPYLPEHSPVSINNTETGVV